MAVFTLVRIDCKIYVPFMRQSFGYLGFPKSDKHQIYLFSLFLVEVMHSVPGERKYATTAFFHNSQVLTLNPPIKISN